MKSLYHFIIKPLDKRYENTKSIGNKELIVNSNIENHIFVSKKAVIVSTPAAYKTKIKIGDEVYIHHNVLRRYYDQKGKEKNSGTYFKNELYFCSPEQIYMYNLKSHLDYCFIKPILNTYDLDNKKEKPNVGIVKYTNNTLEALGIIPGTLITFTPNSEFEFIIDGERLYCMKSNDIALTHEYKGNEKENNPSWAKSS
jgi:hypothetical protein